MNTFDPYLALIASSVVIIVSYFFNVISQRTNIPSVLLLLGSGILLRGLVQRLGISTESLNAILPLLGQVGLILIVLEGALDLHLDAHKRTLILKASGSAVAILILSSLSIGWVIAYFHQESMAKGLAYAVPLSVVSSAILIPSVMNLTESKREFMVYEGTISDIAGIIFFNYLITSHLYTDVLTLSGSILADLLITGVFSLLFCYVLIFIFSRITTKLKLFLIISILVLLYSIGKKYHFSSLIVIFLFGLVLNNLPVFFRGPLARYINFGTSEELIRDFKMITNESAFLIRTFFFLLFGLIIDLNVLTDLRVLFLGTLICVIIYIIRIINLSVLLKSNIFPELFLSPRGLITVLLFFSIPSTYQITGFGQGVLFFVIIVTSVVMMLALLFTSRGKPIVVENLELGATPTTAVAETTERLHFQAPDLEALQHRLAQQAEQVQSLKKDSE
jgi:Kef-type K+ transport system membrane component KefB